MNLDIVILEYGHDLLFLHGCLRNEKHTPSIWLRRTVAKHISC